MDIHIERLSIDNIENYIYQTFIDSFLGNTSLRVDKQSNSAIKTYSYTEILTPFLLPKLKNVHLGKHFGFKGVDINLLLTNQINIDNLVIEITVDILNVLPTKKMKMLLENYPVILSDFQEGGNLYGRSDVNLIDDVLVQKNIKPKQLFLVGGCFQMKDYPEMNIHKINYDHWLIFTTTFTDYFSNALFDKTLRNSLISQLEICPENFCVIPIYKPRLPRLELLAQLDYDGILNKTDWGLNLKLIDSKELYPEYPTLSSDVVQFLTNNKNELPKLLLPSVWRNFVATPTNWFNKYKVYVSAETYMGDEFYNPMGGSGFTSEKTYKGFLLGAAPVIYGPQGIDEYLQNLGFKTLTFGVDCKNPVEISKLLASEYRSNSYKKDIVIHNFELITNIDFLIEKICEPLHKIAELINSIRR